MYGFITRTNFTKQMWYRTKGGIVGYRSVLSIFFALFVIQSILLICGLHPRYMQNSMQMSMQLKSCLGQIKRASFLKPLANSAFGSVTRIGFEPMTYCLEGGRLVSFRIFIYFLSYCKSVYYKYIFIA